MQLGFDWNVDVFCGAVASHICAPSFITITIFMFLRHVGARIGSIGVAVMGDDSSEDDFLGDCVASIVSVPHIRLPITD